MAILKEVKWDDSGLVGIIEKNGSLVKLYPPKLKLEVFDRGLSLQYISELKELAEKDNVNCYEILPSMSNGGAHAIAYNVFPIRKP